MALFKKKAAGDSGASPGESPPAAKTKEKKAKSGGAKAKPVRSKARGKKFIFIIGDEGTILIFLHGLKVVRRLFAPSAQPAHTGAMLEIINANANVPIYVLADVLDQQYLPQTFPPVNSMSVGGLVKRKLERAFQADDLKNSLPLGRDKTGRKEWQFLLIGLSKTPLITEWMDLLINLPNEFKGVYLVPVEAITYIDMLNKSQGNKEPRPWQMLISHNKVSGFRQVVINNGKLVFTRVSQAIDDAIPAVIAGNIEQEIINTLEYLKRLEFKDESLCDITVIVSQDVADPLDLNRFGFGNSQVLTPLKIAEALHLEQAALSADRYGDVVLASAFGIAKKRRLRFSTAYLEKLNKLYQARLGLKMLAGGVVAICALMVLMSLVGIVQGLSETSKAESEKSKLQPDLQKMRTRVGGLNQNVTFKSAVVTTSDVYLKNASQPEDVLKLLVPLISPQARILKFGWSYTDPTAKKEGGAPVDTSKGPVMLTFDVDLANAASDPERLTKAADKYADSVKAALADYEVTVEQPYRWVGERGDSQTFDLAASTVPVDKRVISFTVRGPKKGKAP